MRITSLATVAGLALVAGCANFAPTISKDEKPTGKEAYVYGRFHMDAPVARLAMQGHQTMGFTLKCDDQQTYTIKFDREEPLRVTKVAPSSCAMSEIIYTDADGMIRSRKPAPESVKKSMAFEAGKAYYLGDFYAQASAVTGYQTVNWSWRITNVKNDYRNTTEALKSAFPALSAVATEDRMLGSSK
jgi:hypothetical protein